MKDSNSPLGECTIGQIGFTVSDLETALPFYRDVLGLRHLFSAPPSMAFLEAGGVRIMLSTGAGGDSARYNSILYFKVPDIDAIHAALARNGLSFEREPHLVAKLADHDLWMAFFKDPDGNLLALMSEKKQPKA